MRIDNYNLYYSLSLALALLLFSCSGPNTSSESDASAEVAATTGEERASPLKSISGKIGDKTIAVQYGSPGIKGREIWGDLVPYGEVWRTGANEATYISLEADVLVEGEPLPAGKYSLFTIPREDEPWTVILNSEWDLEHGHFQYKEEHDVLRVDVTPTWVDESQEWLSIELVSDGLQVKWEKLVLPINIK